MPHTYPGKRAAGFSPTIREPSAAKVHQWPAGEANLAAPPHPIVLSRIENEPDTDVSGENGCHEMRARGRLSAQQRAQDRKINRKVLVL